MRLKIYIYSNPHVSHCGLTTVKKHDVAAGKRKFVFIALHGNILPDSFAIRPLVV